ncbi:MAG: GNAT family N-acetyltransferase [Caldilineaceae bacterium]|nr:GNAT family N-acetyltransferase [Caldilineaceae bacterium]
MDAQESSVFHSPEWIRVVAETYSFEVKAYLLLDACSRPIAGFPVCNISDLRGKRLVVFPFSDYYDPLVATPEQWELLLHPLLEQALPIRFRCLHNEVPLHDPRFILFNRAKWHGLDLTPGPDSLWRQLAPECRRAVQKAQRAGLTVRRATDPALLREFFEMHLGLRKQKYRLLAQPYRFFEHIWQHFIEPGHGTLMTIHHQGQMISGAIFLRRQGKSVYKFGASKPEFLSLRPNDLLLWTAIQDAQQSGDRYFDFGLSDWDQQGLIAFKRKFGGEEKTISFLEYRPEISINRSQLPPDLLPTLTALFTDPTVPDIVTERAGELLYRFFV